MPALPCQPGIAADLPAVASYLFFSLHDAAQAAVGLKALQTIADGNSTVIGIGLSTAKALGKDIPGLGAFPQQVGVGIDVPATPFALWCWLRGNDRGELLHRARQVEAAVSPGFVLEGCIDAFKYRDGDDLTGYEDGTENPTGDDALSAAFVMNGMEGLHGSSFVAVQQWVHDFDTFQAMSQKEQDHSIGRRRKDNVELAKAPASAHVKRTAQESFAPPAFILRRSMPWSDGMAAGLVFVAFGYNTAAYEALLARMTGNEDGITDALFRFTQPVTGSYFWCPPLLKGKPDLRLLGIR